MSSDALTAPERSAPARFLGFLRDVRTEIGKVTWPTREEIRKATVVIIIFVVSLGLLIGLMDAVLQLVLVRMVARIF